MFTFAGEVLSASGRRVVVAATLSVMLVAFGARPALAGFQPQRTFGAGNHSGFVAAADFNGDGRPDLAVVNIDDGTVSVLLNATTTGAAIPAFAAQARFETGPNPQTVAAADF